MHFMLKSSNVLAKHLWLRLHICVQSGESGVRWAIFYLCGPQDERKLGGSTMKVSKVIFQDVSYHFKWSECIYDKGFEKYGFL